MIIEIKIIQITSLKIYKLLKLPGKLIISYLTNKKNIEYSLNHYITIYFEIALI